MKLRTFITVVLITVLSASCTQQNHFKVATTSSKRGAEYRKLDKLNQKYIEKFGKKFRFELVNDTSFLLSTNSQLLRDSLFDMALITNANLESNDSTIDGNTDIRSVMPVNSRILYIAYNKNIITPNSIQDVFEGHKVLILSNETEFIKDILSDFGVNIENVDFIKNVRISTDSTAKDTNSHRLNGNNQISGTRFYNAYRKGKPLPYEVEIGFASDNFTATPRLNRFLNTRHEFVLFSLDDYQLFRNGSSAEGFCLRNKYFTPYLLPKGAFGEFPSSPIITIRQDYILAARDNVDDEFIYNFVKMALEETDLINVSTYGQNFENISFAYPLHEGTIRYLDKNAPKFYEKYGDLIEKIGAGVGGFYTALMGLILWRKRTRRKAIFKDYEKVVEIQGNLGRPQTDIRLASLYEELQSIENRYHLMILERKILVDESLQIFLDLIDKNQSIILNELKSRGSTKFFSEE